VAETLDRIFLDYSIQKLRQFESRIAACLEKLSAEQIWARGAEQENAVGNLVLHLSGNARQWIVSGVGADPDIRDRDSEFAARGGQTAADLMRLLHTTVDDAARVLARVTAGRLSERIVIQGYDVSVMEAIYHVVEHFSGHTGQIIFATKMLTGEDLGFYRHLRTAAAHGEKTP
jgi:uncharacterized damage-inducible protein DinB